MILAIFGLSVPELSTPFPVITVLAAAPLVATVLGLLVARRHRLGGVVAVTGSFVALAASLLALWQSRTGALATSARVPMQPSLPGWTTEAGLVATPPVVAAASVLAFVSLVNQLFTQWYLDYDERYPAHATASSAALAGTLLVLLGADVSLVVGGWLLVAGAAYLLIGHWAADGAASRVALVGVASAVLLLSGLLLLGSAIRSTSLERLVQATTSSAATPATVAGALLVAVAVAVGAGQLPFGTWVREGSDGPLTGHVAAHVAGLGAAAAVVALRLQPVLVHCGPAQWLLVGLGALTALVGGAAALVQQDLRQLVVWQAAAGFGVVLLVAGLAPASAPDAGWYAMLALVISIALMSLVVCWASVLVGSTSLARTSRLARHHVLLRFPLAAGLISLLALPPCPAFVTHHLALVAAAQEPSRVLSLVASVGAWASVVLGAMTVFRIWLVLTHKTSYEERMARRAGTGAEIDDFFFEDPTYEEGDNDPTTVPHTGVTMLGMLGIFGGFLPLSPILRVPFGVETRHGVTLTLVVVVAAVVTWLLGRRRFHHDPVYHLPAGVVDALSSPRTVGLWAHGTAWLGAWAAYLVGTAEARGLVAGLDGMGRGAKLGARVAQRLHADRPTTVLAVLVGGAMVLAGLGVVPW